MQLSAGSRDRGTTLCGGRGHVAPSNKNVLQDSRSKLHCVGQLSPQFLLLSAVNGASTNTFSATGPTIGCCWTIGCCSNLPTVCLCVGVGTLHSNNGNMPIKTSQTATRGACLGLRMVGGGLIAGSRTSLKKAYVEIYLLGGTSAPDGLRDAQTHKSSLCRSDSKCTQAPIQSLGSSAQTGGLTPPVSRARLRFCRS